MPTEAKARTIEQAKDWYSRSKGVVFTDYRGLKVKELQELRDKLRVSGGEIHVIKNTLFRVAAGEDATQLPYDLHNGPTAVAFLFGSESEGAKVLLDYAKTNKKLIVKGGFFAGKSFTADQVKTLSELPSREVLISQVIGAISAPLTNLVGVIESLYADPIRVIGAVADKVAEGSPIPAAKASETEPAEAAPESNSSEVEAPAEASEPTAEAEAPAAETPTE